MQTAESLTKKESEMNIGAALKSYHHSISSNAHCRKARAFLRGL
jgi:hypothetical protein